MAKTHPITKTRGFKNIVRAIKLNLEAAIKCFAMYGTIITFTCGPSLP